jgi:hypothetical protein
MKVYVGIFFRSLELYIRTFSFALFIHPALLYSHRSQQEAVCTILSSSVFTLAQGILDSSFLNLTAASIAFPLIAGLDLFWSVWLYLNHQFYDIVRFTSLSRLFKLLLTALGATTAEGRFSSHLAFTITNGVPLIAAYHRASMLMLILPMKTWLENTIRLISGLDGSCSE